MAGCVAIESMQVPYENHVHPCAGHATAPIPTEAVVQGPVMTDEQVEVLRRQISVYCTLCNQLREMHKASIQELHVLDPLPLPANHMNLKGTMENYFHQTVQTRQRWTPSQKQLEILERLFSKGGGTPNKRQLKHITAELSEHGAIQDTNVYNWFQNRKARAKRRWIDGLNKQLQYK